jgi:DNA uptake protein ComE-like DNA-binding protein
MVPRCFRLTLNSVGASMRAQSGRTTANSRILMSALAVLGMSGWAGFAYVSWSAARTERTLQSEIARLTSDRTGTAAARKGPGQESAAMRTVYPGPYGGRTSTSAQTAPSAAPIAAAPTASAQPSVFVTEPAPAERAAGARTLSAPSALPQPSASSAQPIIERMAQDDTRTDGSASQGSDAKLVDINTASVEELNRLGGRFGRAIVAGRPYSSIDELVSRRVLTRSTFSQIKDQITAN